MGRIKDLAIEIDEYFSSRPDEYARLNKLINTVGDDEFKEDADVIEAARTFGISVEFLMTYFERDEGE